MMGNAARKRRAALISAGTELGGAFHHTMSFQIVCHPPNICHLRVNSNYCLLPANSRRQRSAAAWSKTSLVTDPPHTRHVAVLGGTGRLQTGAQLWLQAVQGTVTVLSEASITSRLVHSSLCTISLP